MDVLKQENDVQKQKFCSFFWKILVHFVPGRPGTEEFVPGYLLLPLSRDKGTAGQAKLFCPGTKGQRDRGIFLSRDKGTTGRPAPVCPGTSRGTSRPLETLTWTCPCKSYNTMVKGLHTGLSTVESQVQTYSEPHIFVNIFYSWYKYKPKSSAETVGE